MSSIDVETPNDQPRTNFLVRKLCCEGFLPLKKKVTLKHNLGLLLNCGCIDTNLDHEIKLVVNCVHTNLYSK